MHTMNKLQGGTTNNNNRTQDESVWKIARNVAKLFLVPYFILFFWGKSSRDRTSGETPSSYTFGFKPFSGYILFYF
ncbi:uncharacterized protein SPAPADRAFT_61424 [Spathaspora passalidarum NRRL Y-27907]|uniref:Uncharacterized protein n=1 Tax=Spathaspora passalidarum (strain NRRL Y-27907 / 11-Y1) TaxID=619300 RepID=G3AQ24_SPAPN|nr:uncharacterized protein SPAPADRAFT_61424 [Spathaspora passalidarum NRRL Y-27907]EGW32345.1 hypothetical protein SPAPADRAFT_61424 [Spathaspora passalidarum NRRL Y-27907]